MTESSTVALFSSKRMSGFPDNVSLMLRGLVPWQVEHCGNQGHMEVATHAPHIGQAGDRQSSGGLSQPHNSVGPPPRSHRPWTSQIYRANRSGSMGWHSLLQAVRG